MTGLAACLSGAYNVFLGWYASAWRANSSTAYDMLMNIAHHQRLNCLHGKQHLCLFQLLSALLDRHLQHGRPSLHCKKNALGMARWL